MSTSIDPIGPGDFGQAQAHHLLNRAGFGGTPSQVETLRAMGLDRAVSFLVDYDQIDDTGLARPAADPDIIRRPTAQERARRAWARKTNDRAVLDQFNAQRQRQRAEDRRQMAQVERWWLGRMIATPRPLQEKLTLLWHGHFATSYRTVRDSFLMLKQNELFRQHAKGSFADLAGAMVRDPAMLRYLNNDRNRKGKPNENLARELMELFTLGEGNYGERDIKEGARALTGYTVRGNDFHLDRAQHDGGLKRILGKSGPIDGDQFVGVLLGHDACAPWVCTKLYRHFVSDVSEGISARARTVIDRLAARLRNDKYELAPVLKTLFKSRHFYDPQVQGNKIKTPAELLVGTIRVVGAPVRDVGILTDAMHMMGQKLFAPPSVAGWDYGRAWINTSTLFVRQNTCAYLVSGKLPFEDAWSRDRIRFDPQALVPEGTSHAPQDVVDHVATTVLGPTVKIAPEHRSELVDFMAARDDPVSDDALIALLLLITGMPEYQLC